MKKLILILLLAGIYVLWAQTPSSNYLSWYEKAEENYNAENPTETTDSIALAHYIKIIGVLKGQHLSDSILWDASVKAGILLQTQRKNSEAIRYFETSIETQFSSKLPDSISFLPLLYTGNAFYFEQRFDSAVYFFEKAETLLSKYPGIKGRERLYNALGVLNYETGNYKQSKNYFEKALQTIERVKGADPSLSISYRNNIAFCLKKLQQNREALEVYLSLLKYNFNIEELNLNIASVYTSLNEFTEAIAYLKKIKTPTPVSLNLYAKVYLSLQKPDSAASYLNQALSMETFTTGTNPGTTFRLLGDMYAQKAQFDLALKNYQISINALHPSFNDSDPSKNPKDFKGVITTIDLYESLLAKALLLEKWHKASGYPVYAEMSIASFRALYSLSNCMSSGYETDEAKLFLNEKKYISHDIPIQLAFTLYQKTHERKYLEELFFFDEENKASVLSEERNLSTLKKQVGIPDSLIALEGNAKKLLNQLGIQRSQSADSTTIAGITARIAEIELEIENIQKQYKSNSNYQQLASISSITDLSTTRGKLTSNDLILSYHLSASSVICTFISKDSVNVFEIKNKDTLVANLHTLTKLTTEVGKHGREEYNSIIDRLSETLILPYYSQLSKYSNWYIIPDDELSYLPFELLSIGEGKKVVTAHIISYNSSCSLLTHGEQNKNKENILAFAPFAHSGKPEFAQLSKSASELDNLKGAIYLDGLATKDQFLKQAKEFGVLHLATHALSNESDPQQSYIAFASKDSNKVSLLYLPEIYSLDLRETNLTILSACETGTGQLIKGEGLISFSRAFAYAGCENTIASQWKASDESTAYIMQRFHQYYGKSQNAAEALTLAKRDYLNDNNIEVRFKTPDFWANLRLNGVVEKPTSLSKWWWLLLLPAIVLFFRLLKNKKSSVA